jgi:hypothetical protein
VPVIVLLLVLASIPTKLLEDILPDVRERPFSWHLFSSDHHLRVESSKRNSSTVDDGMACRT